MNLLDLAILLCIGFFLYRGIKKGLIREAFALIALVGALVCAVVFVKEGVSLVKEFAEVPASLGIFISFVLIFLIVYLIIRIIGATLSGVIHLSLLGWLDRLGGFFFGLFQGILFASLLLLCLVLLSWPRNIDTIIRDSALGPSVQMAAPRFFNHMKFIIPSAKSIYSEFQESVHIYSEGNPQTLNDKEIQQVLRIFQKAE
jgi:membrane protein required for colicin V production